MTDCWISIHEHPDGQGPKGVTPLFKLSNFILTLLTSIDQPVEDCIVSRLQCPVLQVNLQYTVSKLSCKPKYVYHDADPPTAVATETCFSDEIGDWPHWRTDRSKFETTVRVTDLVNRKLYQM